AQHSLLSQDATLLGNRSWQDKLNVGVLDGHHETANDGVDRGVLVQYFIEPPYQRHVNADRIGLFTHQFQRVDPFCYLTELPGRVVQLFTFADSVPNTEITTLVGGAGGTQVAHARQPHTGHRIGSEAHGKPTHLRQPARYQHGFGVFAQIKGRRKASHNGINILQGTGKFNAININVGVYPEILTAQKILNGAANFGIFSRNHGCREFPVNNFTSEIGTAQHAGATPWNLFQKDLAHQFEAMLLDTFGQADDNLPVPECLTVIANNRTKSFRGNSNEHDV